MKVGDRVRVVRVPASLPDDRGTRSLLASCIGRTFSIVGFQGHLLELEVGEILGKEPYMDSIWIEPEHVEVVADADP